MLDGIYNVQAKTPFGTREGLLVMVTEGDKVLTDLMVGEKTKRLEGTLDGDVVTFEGSVRVPFPFRKLNFTLVGTVTGDELKGICTAKKFKFDVTGTRIPDAG